MPKELKPSDPSAKYIITAVMIIVGICVSVLVSEKSALDDKPRQEDDISAKLAELRKESSIEIDRLRAIISTKQVIIGERNETINQLAEEALKQKEDLNKQSLILEQYDAERKQNAIDIEAERRGHTLTKNALAAAKKDLSQARDELIKADLRRLKSEEEVARLEKALKVKPETKTEVRTETVETIQIVEVPRRWLLRR